MSRVTYRKGPLGYAVSLDGKPVGSIKDVRQHGGWQVRVPGLNAAVLQSAGVLFQGRTVFKTIGEAKAAVEAHLLSV